MNLLASLGAGPPPLLGDLGLWVSLALSLNLLVLFGKRLRILPNFSNRILPMSHAHQTRWSPGLGGEQVQEGRQGRGVGHGVGLLGGEVLGQSVSVLVLKCSGLPPELTAPPAPQPRVFLDRKCSLLFRV